MSLRVYIEKRDGRGDFNKILDCKVPADRKNCLGRYMGQRSSKLFLLRCLNLSLFLIYFFNISFFLHSSTSFFFFMVFIVLAFSYEVCTYYEILWNYFLFSLISSFHVFIILFLFFLLFMSSSSLHIFIILFLILFLFRVLVHLLVLHFFSFIFL